MKTFIFKFILFTLLFASFTFNDFTFAQTSTLDATLTLEEINGVKVPYQNGMVVPSFEKQNRTIINLKGDWKKERFAASDNISLAKRDATGYLNIINEAAGRNTSSFDDNGWETKVLPAVENTMNPYPTVPEYYQDGVWYRKSFNVDAADSGKFVKLMFYAVNYVADVWLNDVYLGYHEGGYTPFAFDVSSALNYGGNNVLVVRVDNPMWNSRNDIVPYTACDWFNYTGIIHDVYLEFSHSVSVARTNIVPQNVSGDIQTSIIILNDLSVTKDVVVDIEVFEADINENNFNSEFAHEIVGVQVPISGITNNSISVLGDSVSVWQTNLSIADPKLWSMKNPDLYVMKVKLTVDGNIVDEYYTQFGIRKLDIVSDKFYLNNETVFLTGVARHEDHPVFGRSIPIDTIYSDLKKVKGVNSTSLRTAHYPNHLQTYLLADRLGIAIIEEIPVWWFDTETAWNIQNNERHIHEQMFREMVFKDYNRPSIFLWSTTNECLDVPNRKIFIERVNQDLKQNYADGRFITQSAAADRPGSSDDSQNACDVMGWTMYFGIFHGSTYFTGTNNFLNDVKINLPGKPILDTEFGYWSSENGTTTQDQIDVFNYTFLAFKIHAALSTAGTINETGALMGCTWWCIFDWYSHQHPGGYQSMGLYGMDRITAKPVASVLKSGYLPFFNLGGAVTDVEESNVEIPIKFSLEQNYPNPFNPETKIVFSLPYAGNVKLKIFDVLGNEVSTLLNEFRAAGRYEVDFNIDIISNNISSGVYFYRIEADNFVSTKKMIYLK
jgi:beta-glucuronidase